MSSSNECTLVANNQQPVKSLEKPKPKRQLTEAQKKAFEKAREKRHYYN
jgi:hypothetical protein